MITKICLLIIGFALLIIGAELLLKGATMFTKKTKVSEIIVGIFIVALGTSLPEIFLTIKSSLSGNTELILGNAIGSSICNFLLVLGIACVTKPIKLDLKMCEYNLAILAISVIILGFLSNNMFEIGFLDKKEAVILLLATVFYMGFNVWHGKNTNSKDEKDKKEKNSKNKTKDEDRLTLKSFFTIIFLIAIGGLMLNFGSDFVIDGATYIAKELRVTAEVISLTIIAAGTALPEIVTSIIASKNHNDGLVVGNVIGSNVYNIILLPAIGAIISPIKFGANLNNSLLFLGLITTGMMIRYVGFGDNLMTKKRGIAFITIYILYIAILVV